MFGTRNTDGTWTGHSLVTLANGSTFRAVKSPFNGNMETGGTGSNTDPTVVFDIQDPASSITFRKGNLFADLAAVEAGEGKYWTSSTLGDANLVSTDNGTTFTVTVVPEPSALALLLLGVAFCGRRRRS